MTDMHAMILIYCDSCEANVDLTIEPMTSDDLNGDKVWGDVVCPVCGFVIATLTMRDETTGVDEQKNSGYLVCWSTDVLYRNDGAPNHIQHDDGKHTLCGIRLAHWWDYGHTESKEMVNCKRCLAILARV